MTRANDSRRIRRLGGRGEGGGECLDEKDRVARGARERSGNWRRNGERRETRKPGRNNDFPREETRNFLLRKGGSFSFSINCFVPFERKGSIFYIRRDLKIRIHFHSNSIGFVL